MTPLQKRVSRLRSDESTSETASNSLTSKRLRDAFESLSEPAKYFQDQIVEAIERDRDGWYRLNVKVRNGEIVAIQSDVALDHPP